MNTSLHPALDLAWRFGVVIVFAVLLAFIAPPVNLHWLHWFAYIPVMLAFRTPTERLPFRKWLFRAETWMAVVYGIVAEGAIFHWIIDTITVFSNIPFIAAAGILFLFSIVFGMPYIALWWLYPTLRRRFGTWWVLALPAAMVVIEWVGMWIILFPYNQGIGHYRVPTTFQLVSVTGVWGLTFLVLFVNAAIAEVLLAWREKRALPLAWIGAAAGLWGAVNLWGAWRYAQVEETLAEAPTLRVFQVQDDIQMLDRLDSFPCETWNYWYGQTARLSPGEVDLVVWSEGASVYPLNLPRKARKYRGAPCEDISDPLGKLEALSAELGAEFVVGSAAREYVMVDGERQRRSMNSTYHITPTGKVERYDKLVPLPFGEYIPLSDTFPFLRDMIEGPGNFQAGSVPVVFEGKARLATPICYEAILPHVCRRYDHPDLLVNGSLDTWFGDTAAPHQHAMLATARATELGIPLFRNAYTGVSMVVEPHGRIYAETEPYTEVARVVTVRLGKAWTLYGALAPYGLQDWFVFLCLGGLLVGRVAAPWWAARQNGEAGHEGKEEDEEG